MSPLPDWSSSLAEQDSKGSDDSPRASMSHEQRLLALEEDVIALQGLVCYLLEKNEYLRMQFRLS
jgi:hypothetical protein